MGGAFISGYLSLSRISLVSGLIDKVVGTQYEL